MPTFAGEAAKEKGGYAGFWWRVLAYTIDSIILSIVTNIIGAAFSIPTVGREVLSGLLAFVYSTSFIAVRSRTIGMMITRMRVESVDGGAITLRQSAIRSGFYVILLSLTDVYHRKTYPHPTTAQVHLELHYFAIVALLSIPHLIDNIWMLWDKRRQTLHDKLARTVVRR